jgi:septum formation protein
MSKKILLASSSPRRKELMTNAGVIFEIKVPDVDETEIPGEAPVKMVRRLSLEKATAVWRRFMSESDSALIVAADTTVVDRQNKILGKPRDVNEAIQMITRLQGKHHHVYTGYSVIEISKGKLKRIKTASVKTKVTIRKLSPSEVKAYVAFGESLDKAGAYGAQSFGMTIVEKIEGSYTNVVGLPIAEVLDDLKKFGWKL